MQKIIPHIWYDREAVEAAKFYASTFPKSKVTSISQIHDTPSGDCDIVEFEIMGYKFMSISAGPYFKLNPSISFLVMLDSKKEVDNLYSKLSVNGKTLMPLDSYPFSERYAWIEDKYGVSWQLMYSSKKSKQKIVPMLMFVGKNCGKTEEAINLYKSIFSKSKIGEMMRYGKGQEPDKEGTVNFVKFTLEGQDFAAMDSAHKHEFQFNEAVSFLVDCDTQKEIDYYWEKLSAYPEAEQCGWLKDKYGVSWQINPAIVNKMMKDKDPKKVERVTKAFLKMKKFDIKELKKAYDGKK